MHNNKPGLGPVVAGPCGPLIISQGKSDLCIFFFLSFFEPADCAEVSLEGTAGAASVVFCRRVRGAMMAGERLGRVDSEALETRDWGQDG